MNTTDQLRTQHFILRMLQPGDAVSLHRIYLSKDVLRYFPDPSPPPLERVRRYIDGQREHWEKFGYGNWGILPVEEKEIIGWAGLQYLPELNETEIGFLLDRPYWGKGYATEAAQLSLRFGFEEIGLHQIIALVHPENLASRRVIEKCFMIYQETLTLWGIELMRFQIDKTSW
jgi:ribosomal-protein-alanine N-acetyltransferase